METLSDFIFFGSKITAHTYYFDNKGPSSQGLVFPVVMYGCENWTIKKAEQRKLSTEELMVLNCGVGEDS